MNFPVIFALALMIRLRLISALEDIRDSKESYHSDQSSSFLMSDNDGQSENMWFPYQQKILPRDVLPEKYHLWMKPRTDGKTDFCGEVTIELKCVHSTRYIILHSKNLNITNYSLHNKGSSQPVDILSMKKNPKNDQILFETNSPLVSEEQYELFIAFGGHMINPDIPPRTHNYGFFTRSYFKKDGTKKTYVYTMLILNSASTAFPCFNDPGFKSVFLVTIKHDKSLKAATNTPLVKQVPRSNGMVESVFEASVKMSSYHVAFAISDFATNSTYTKRGTKIVIWARQEVIHEVTSYLEVAASVVTTMEKYTGINYPYKELNIYGIQYSVFAFEAFGLIVIWDRYLKWENTRDHSKIDEYYLRTFIPHELVHMWFGGIFTIKDWHDVWLYQGLTQFFQHYVVEQYDSSYKSDMLLVGEEILNGLSQDSVDSTPPMNNPKLRGTFGLRDVRRYLHFMKGAALFNMLQKLLGKKVFQEGIRKYLNKYKYNNSNSAELWEVFQSLKPSFDVKTVMHEWEYQSGYQVVNIKYVGKDTNGNKVYTATQSRYVDGLTPDDPKYQAKYSKYSWYVPFWYADSSSPTADPHLVWMNKTSVNITVPGCAKWIKGNARQAGFYRVMYEQDMWDNLAKQLNDHHKAFSAMDRNGLISDAYEFWQYGKRFNITVPMKIMAYLKKERSTFPMRQAVDYLHKIAKKIRQQPDVFQPFKKHLTYLFKETLWSSTWEDPVFQRKLFADLFDVLAYIGEQTVVKKGLQIVENWIRTGKYNDEYIYIRQSVYEMAARYGNEIHWKFLYEQYKSIANVNATIDIDEDKKNERKRLLDGLSTTKSNQIINVWLNDSYLESISNKTDIWEKLEQVSRFNPGRDNAWIYFKTNFEQIVERDARVNGNMTKSFLDFTKYFDEQCHLEDVEKFARSKPKLWSFPATNTSLETIRTNMKWLKKNKQPLLNFLASQGHQ